MKFGCLGWMLRNFLLLDFMRIPNERLAQQVKSRRPAVMSHTNTLLIKSTERYDHKWYKKKTSFKSNTDFKHTFETFLVILERGKNYFLHGFLEPKEVNFFFSFKIVRLEKYYVGSHYLLMVQCKQEPIDLCVRAILASFTGWTEEICGLLCLTSDGKMADQIWNTLSHFRHWTLLRGTNFPYTKKKQPTIFVWKKLNFLLSP